LSEASREPGSDLPVTALRRCFEHARSLEPAAQIQACVECLTCPGQVANLVFDAHRVLSTCFDGDGDAAEVDTKPDESPVRSATLVEDFFWETRELMVLGDASFTCLATNVHPLAMGRGDESHLSQGVDYVGLTCDSSSTLVLGAVQAPGDSTAYPLLLRLLACLTEIAHPSQLERMNRDHFMGVARESTEFDLNLVLWDKSDDPETTPISQLTRDLAENVKSAIEESSEFPKVLRDIVCLKMNPDRFDGRLRFDWRV
jgi:hypothetical protein